MSHSTRSRREFLQLAGAAASAGLTAPYVFSADAEKSVRARRTIAFASAPSARAIKLAYL